MITVIVVVFFFGILALDLLPSWKNMRLKARVLYCALMLVSFSVIFLYTFDVPIPSPSTPIRDLIDTLFPMLNE